MTTDGGRGAARHRYSVGSRPPKCEDDHRGDSASTRAAFASATSASQPSQPRSAEVNAAGRDDPVVNFIAGAVATLVTRAAIMPVDTLKTNLQHYTPAAGTARAPTAAGWRALTTVVRRIVAPRGVRGFWRGLPAAVAGGAPAQAVYMSVYEACKTRFAARAAAAADRGAGGAERGAPLRFWHIAVSAAVGDCVAALVRVPPEVIKQQLQTGQHANTWSAIRTIAASRGLGGFYQGFFGQVARDVPFAVALFGMYEFLNARCARQRDERRAQLGRRQRRQRQQQQQERDGVDDEKRPMWTGGVAGALAAAVTMPLDVARTRLMTTRRYRGVGDAIVRVAREEGALRLWAGTLPRVLYKIPSSSIFLASFELTRRALYTLAH